MPKMFLPLILLFKYFKTKDMHFVIFQVFSFFSWLPKFIIFLNYRKHIQLACIYDVGEGMNNLISTSDGMGPFRSVKNGRDAF